jgi:hypothetical protein
LSRDPIGVCNLRASLPVGSGVKLVGKSFIIPGISPELGQKKIKKSQQQASNKLDSSSGMM